MLDLDDQIRKYFEATTTAGATTFDVTEATPVSRLDVASLHPTRRPLRISLVAAAVIAIVGVGGLLAFRQNGEPDLVETVAGDDAQSDDDHDGVAAVVPSTPEPSIPPSTLPPTSVEATPAAVGVATSLVWERVDVEETGSPLSDASLAAGVIDAGDRLLVVHGEQTIEAISTSVDGIVWTTRQTPESPGEAHGVVAAWQDTIVVASGGGGIAVVGGAASMNPSQVVISRPDTPLQTTIFEGASIGPAAIGPAGIVLIEGPRLFGDIVVHNVLGSGATANLSGFTVDDGVLRATMNDGEIVEIVLAEYGYDGDDLEQDTPWFSSDGERWIEIAEFPGGVRHLIATETGFLGFTDRTAWHSTDGIGWQAIGEIDIPHPPRRWQGGAVLTDGAVYVAVTAEGVRELSALPLPEPGAAWDRLQILTAGGLGIAHVDLVAGEYRFSSDGDDWASLPLPVAMAAADGSGWFSPSGTAADQAVLMLLFEADGLTPAWWLGTPVIS